MRVTVMKDKRSVKGYFIHATRDEAISIIASLAKQISENNPNWDRLESTTDDGKYFTIAVDPVSVANPYTETNGLGWGTI